MSSQTQQSTHGTLLIIHDNESYEEAVQRTLLDYRKTIAELQEEKRSSLFLKNILLLAVGLVLYLILVSVM